MKHSLLLASVVIASLLSAGCDPEDDIREYFSDHFLHQVQTPTESTIKLGQVFLSHRGRKSDVLGNMFDTYGQAGWLAREASQDVVEDDSMRLPSLSQTTLIEPSLGIDVFTGLFKLNPLEGVEIESAFTISSIVARSRLIAGPVVDRYLDSSDSEGFRRYLAERVHRPQRNARVTVVYKILRTNTMSITAQEGRNISSQLSVTSPAVSVSAGFSVKKTSERTLEIDSDTDHVFAVGLLRLVQNRNAPLIYSVSYEDLRPLIPE